ncbi:MAG: rRNA pseudouridine synthase [Calditrichaeota bacterium]|nr:rRNA pseudouridine synthase [Calditrichota bacterium]
MRLAKFLAGAGVASRRASEKIIFNGHVKVNGRIIKDPALDVSEADMIYVNGAKIAAPSPDEFVYIMFHKPVGVLSTMSPGMEEGPCIADLLKHPKRIFPVGRLDKDSSGLILMTNDGKFANRLIHPSHRVVKEYQIKVNRQLSKENYYRLRKGIEIDGRAVEVHDLTHATGGRITLSIHEGRKRIIRRLMREIKMNTVGLKRIRIGTLTLGSLGIGRWRKLTELELQNLQRGIQESEKFSGKGK